jgi:Tol biopolymer transport system component
VVPEIFGPGFISTEARSAGGIAFSPDGNEIYFGSAGLWVTRQVSGVWTSPGPATFSGAASSFEPGMAPGGQRLYFASGMDGDANGPQIWYLGRAGEGWSAPTKLGPGSLTGGKMAPTAASNGNLYFTSVQGQMGWFYMARWSNGTFEAPVKLPSTINAYSRMDHGFIAPDESWFVLSAVSAAGQCLYVSFKESGGNWRTPVRLDANVNATINQIQPSISPDGKYLFFTRWNGEHGDIWWVDARVVFDLRAASQGPEAASGVRDQ